MAYDDYPDDMSDHPDHPENHNYEPSSNDVGKPLTNVPCARCGVVYKDHPKLPMDVTQHTHTLSEEKRAIVVEPEQRWVARNAEGKIIRKLRILAKHPDGDWIVVDCPVGSKMFLSFSMTLCPEFNLKYVFDLLDETQEPGQTV